MSDTELYSVLISIILPVYNTPISLLKRSINSILEQDYSNFELIIIDDGGSEDVFIACDELALLDKRMRTIHQNHAGVSAARNRGIEEARGEFLMFIDADNELVPGILPQAASIALDNDLDIDID